MVCKLQSSFNLLMMCRMLKNKGITKVENKSALGYLIVDKVPGSSIYRRQVGCQWKCLPLPLTLDGSQDLPDGSRSRNPFPQPSPSPYLVLIQVFTITDRIRHLFFLAQMWMPTIADLIRVIHVYASIFFNSLKKSVNMITSTKIAQEMYRLT